MKTIIKCIIYQLFLLILCTQSFSQCKFERVFDTIYSTSTADLGGGNSTATFSILRMGSSFVLKLEYARGFFKKIEITPATPLVFVFNNDSTVKLFPMMTSETDTDPELGFYDFLWTGEIGQLYPISVRHLEQLKSETPKEINLYYYVKKKKSEQPLIEERYQLLHYDWHYKRMIKILECALMNKK